MNRNNFYFMVFVFIAALFGTGNASAQAQYEIKEMTPEVKTSLDNRKARFEQLKALKSAGVVGENNHGYVEVLKDESGAKELADSENKDRRMIYKTIEEQNHLSGAIATIEKVFAQVQRDKAGAGDKIQNEQGDWIAK